MCLERELERDERDERQEPQEQIRRLFERYRVLAREPARAGAQGETEERREEPVLTAH